MRRSTLGIKDLEVMIGKYIADAAALAEGEPMHVMSCWLDGITTPAELSAAIKECGALYIAKMAALRNAAPVVRGDTISVFQPQEAPENYPSKEDEDFLNRCRKTLRETGYVLAADADMYEKIVAKYPQCAHPARVRGAEAKRWRALSNPSAVIRGKNKPLK